jgi:hypothetical protein
VSYPEVTLTHPALAGWVPPLPQCRRGANMLNSKLLSVRAEKLGKNWDEGLPNWLASFETRPLGRSSG